MILPEIFGCRGYGKTFVFTLHPPYVYLYRVYRLCCVLPDLSRTRCAIFHRAALSVRLAVCLCVTFMYRAHTGLVS